MFQSFIVTINKHLVAYAINNIDRFIFLLSISHQHNIKHLLIPMSSIFIFFICHYFLNIYLICIYHLFFKIS